MVMLIETNFKYTIKTTNKILVRIKELERNAKYFFADSKA